VITQQTVEGNPAGRSGSPSKAESARAAAGMPGELWHRAKASAGTTPGRLTLMLVGLVVLSLVVGVVGMLMVGQKQNQLDDLISHREPVSSASQQIYRSLNDAEASSGAAFLAGGGRSAQQRERYQKDVSQAGSALAVAAGETTVTSGDGPVKKLSTLLPKYSGLLETAAANNRQGFPVGASYLLEASNLMRNEMLPAALELYGQETQKLNAEQDDASSFPWISAVLVVALLVALFLVQRYLRARTNRMFNRGLAFASAAVVVALLWSVTALIFAAVNVSSASGNGSEQVTSLSRMRLLVVQARANETLGLAASDPQRYLTDYDSTVEKLVGADGNGGFVRSAVTDSKGTAVEQDVQAAQQETKDWLATHKKLQGMHDSGKTDQAIKMAVGPDANGSAGQFNAIDTRLLKATDTARQSFVHDTSAAGNSLILLDIGIIVLCVAAAAGATVGIWQRLREYR
jgi:hypothetical protein